MDFKIAVLAGDGIGPEISVQGVDVMSAVCEKFGHKVSYEYAICGADAIDKVGDPFPEATYQVCKDADAVLFSAVGDPKFDNDPTAKVRPEQGLLAMRKKLGLFANILIIKHISDSNFHFGMFQHFPFAEYKMDMVIGHSFVMVKCRTTFYTIPFMKAVREKPYYIICLVLNKTFWKCNDKLSSFNTFPCCSTCLKIQLILSGKIFPEL